MSKQIRILSPQELDQCGLAQLGWENCTVDTSKYYPNIGAVAEVDAETYVSLRDAGIMVQRVHDKCYVGLEMDATDIILGHAQGLFDGTHYVSMEELYGT